MILLVIKTVVFIYLFHGLMKIFRENSKIDPKLSKMANQIIYKSWHNLNHLWKKQTKLKTIDYW